MARLSQETLTKQAVDLSVVMAKRLLDSIMTVKEQSEVIDKKIKDLEVWANGQRAS